MWNGKYFQYNNTFLCLVGNIYIFKMWFFMILWKFCKIYYFYLCFFYDTMKNCVYQNHISLQLELKKQLVYNYCATIPLVLQLLLNYPPRNMGN
jgi:hypothetical protein